MVVSKSSDMTDASKYQGDRSEAGFAIYRFEQPPDICLSNLQVGVHRQSLLLLYSSSNIDRVAQYVLTMILQH